MSSARRFDYRKLDPGFVEQAPVRFTVERELPCTPERLFEIFEDAEAWTKWAGLKFVTWTSEKPYGAGTTRTVGVGPIEIDEVFFTFDRGERMSFYVASGTTQLLAAFAEDYRVRAVGTDRCHFSWSFGVELAGLARVLHPLVGLAAKQNFAGALAKLETYVAETAR
ncbi:MAG: SRPBCC family protein [Myxococcota bacterium]